MKEEFKFETDNFRLNKSNILLIFGIILILFASVYIFTRHSFIKSFDFSKTGQIGDTIGGITAPIINLVGAILVYLSFKAQVRANRIQFKILNKELQNRKYDRNFEITLDLFKQLKEDFTKLSYKDYNGKEAIYDFVNEIKMYTSNKGHIQYLFTINIYSDFHFILTEYYLIVNRIENVIMRADERSQLYSIIYTFYSTQLSHPCRIIRKVCEQYELEPVNTKLIYSIMESQVIINDKLKNK